MENIKLSLAHLYPKLLNLYGDWGNILALKKRCEWRNIELEVTEVDIGDSVKPHDIYFIGGGQDKQQQAVSEDILKHREFFIKERDNDKVFLGICGGYQLLGKYYEDQNGNTIEGLGLIDFYTKGEGKRLIGNVVSTANFEGLEQTLAGFENHSGVTHLGEGVRPLAKIKRGFGNDGKGRHEGVWDKNVFGTYLHGSFLPKNPKFADYILKLALRNKYGESFELKELNDSLELKTHNFLVENKR